ncbi:hypothetical protein ACSFBF_09645 [Variovorax sp. ZT5P49]|uniref:hypothetical protein n=1 Tax=Variovorax sp. ZT5P49 TaxID=3443733 RepID=UPI003F48C671
MDHNVRKRLILCGGQLDGGALENLCRSSPNQGIRSPTSQGIIRLRLLLPYCRRLATVATSTVEGHMNRRTPFARALRQVYGYARAFVGRPAADALRGLVRCIFPIASLLLWVALIFSDQGKDVLRHVVEALSADESINDAAFLGLATTGLGLSIWYTLRWMLTVQLAGVRFRRKEPGWFRVLLPRVAGAAVPMLVAVCVLFLVPPDASGEPAARQKVQTASYLIGGSFVVIAVAMFVFFVSRRKIFRLGKSSTLPLRAPLPTETRLVLWWSTGALLMLSVIFTLVPLAGPRVIGSAAAPALAVAVINLIGTFLLTYLPMKRGIPSLAIVVVAWAVLAGFLNDNHTLRDAPDAKYPAADRPDLREALKTWLTAQGVTENKSRTGPDRVYPIIIVASEGGGIRAAYWTAAVLDKLHAPRPPEQSTFDASRHVFALSGVSGGSLGLASWLAVRRGNLCPPPPSVEPPSYPPTTAPLALSRDFLSPALVGLFYYDLAQSFWPWPYPWFDRSRGLEEGWQRAHSQVPGRPFEHTLGALYEGCPQLPLLFMNTTVVETGQRGIMAPVSLEFIKSAPEPAPDASAQWGRDVVDLMDRKWTTSTQPLSGLVHHSARFPIVSPPGSVESSNGREGRQQEDRTEAFRRHHQPHTRMRLVDGGYFDNSGVQTALDLFLALKGLKDVVPGVQLRPVLLVVSNSGAADPDGASQVEKKLEPSAPRLLHDSLSPLRALVGVRDSHTRIMLAEAQERFGADNVIKIPMPLNAKGADPALGWSLSSHATQFMDGKALSAVEEAYERIAKASCNRSSGSDVCEAKP